MSMEWITTESKDEKIKMLKKLFYRSDLDMGWVETYLERCGDLERLERAHKIRNEWHKLRKNFLEAIR